MKEKFTNLRIFIEDTWAYIKTHTFRENKKRFFGFIKLQVIFLLRKWFIAFTKWTSVDVYEQVVFNMYKDIRTKREIVLGQSEPIRVKKGKIRYHVVFIETTSGQIKAVLKGENSYVKAVENKKQKS